MLAQELGFILAAIEMVSTSFNFGGMAIAK
jgi:hypothetical protein